MAISYLTGPEFTDYPDADALPVSGLQDDSPAVPASDVSPRARRPSELDLRASTPSPDGRFLTVSQAALALHVCPQRVRALISRGFLRAEKVNSRLIRIRRSDLKYVAVRSPGRPKG